MNHDYAHCLDFRNGCPRDCFRAELVRDLNKRTDLYGKPIDWMSFRWTSECPKWKEGEIVLDDR